MAVECPDYEPQEGGKQCEFFLSGGTCSLANRFTCIEWEKAQARKAAKVGAAATASVGGSTPGAPSVSAPPTGRSTPAGRSLPVVKAEAPKIEVPAAFDRKAIEAFKAQGIEVDFSYPGAEEELWTLVGSYTGKARREVSIDDAAIISTLVAAFPGSRVVSLTRKTPEPKKDP